MEFVRYYNENKAYINHPNYKIKFRKPKAVNPNFKRHEKVVEDVSKQLELGSDSNSTYQQKELKNNSYLYCQKYSHKNELKNIFSSKLNLQPVDENELKRLNKNLEVYKDEWNKFMLSYTQLEKNCVSCLTLRLKVLKKELKLIIKDCQTLEYSIFETKINCFKRNRILGENERILTKLQNSYLPLTVHISKYLSKKMEMKNQLDQFSFKYLD